MPKQQKEDEIEASEKEAWTEFKSLKKPRERAPIRAEDVRANAEAAREVARLLLAQDAPERAPAVVPVYDQPQLALDAPEPVAPSLEVCSCGQTLGHATFGVCVEGQWLCPKCFMKSRDYVRHPVARAVNCPTCGRTSVDFTGKNACGACHRRGCQPLRPSL